MSWHVCMSLIFHSAKTVDRAPAQAKHALAADAFSGTRAASGHDDQSRREEVEVADLEGCDNAGLHSRYILRCLPIAGTCASNACTQIRIADMLKARFHVPYLLEVSLAGLQACR